MTGAEKTRRWRERHPGAGAASTRKWRAKNAERARAAVRAWERNNPDAVKAQRRKHKDRINLARRKRLHRYKMDVLRAYSDPPCCKACGVDTIEFLCLDHVNDDGNVMRQEHGRGSSIYRWAQLHGHPDTLQILCYNCNHLKRPKASTRYSAYRDRIRVEVLTHYANGKLKCALCDVSDHRVLTIDHMSGSGNAHRRALKITSGTEFYSWLKRSGFPGGYRVLCFNHNSGR